MCFCFHQIKITKTFYFLKMGFLILFFVSNSFFKGVGGYPITTSKLNPPNPKEALF
ncbi:hypothetical protein HPIN_00990 [Helicobacter pylori India7]|uniref:Uncharacterized protein n=1 Tax=Helicobacter pylori (strain India7) TaxID=907238 RepID=E8QE67_HELP7|nr:hypothetical protein HPIN_00990 [Helicobacter pylori India7]